MVSDEEMREIYSRLEQCGYRGEVRFNEPLYAYTTFKLGGPCELFFMPGSTPDIRTAIRFLNERNIPWAVLGGGSNVLFPDRGFNGGIIKIGEAMAEFEEEDDHLFAGAGMPLSRLMRLALIDGYAGFDFLVGIPGTVGGAVAVNAGTKDDWIDKLVLWAEAVDENGDPVRLMKPKGGYRTSPFNDRNYTVTAVAFARRECDRAEVKQKMRHRMKAKVAAQPYAERSAGSVFKNPQDASAWELIDSVGLKGHRHGGAEFSGKHCNFIVCSEGATSEDVLALINLAEERVREEKGIELEREIALLGFDIPVPEPELPFEEAPAPEEEQADETADAEPSVEGEEGDMPADAVEQPSDEPAETD